MSCVSTRPRTLYFRDTNGKTMSTMQLLYIIEKMENNIQRLENIVQNLLFDKIDAIVKEKIPEKDIRNKIYNFSHFDYKILKTDKTTIQSIYK